MTLKSVLFAAATSLPVAVTFAEPATTTLPPIDVWAHVFDGQPLQEEAPTGAYGQPDWLSNRRFATTRAYIQQDPWEVGVEQWWRSRDDGGHWSHLFQEEVEIGLPGRFQFDLYYDWSVENHNAEYQDTAVELRWALADWDKIFLNPTIYLEYKFVDPKQGGDIFEPKLLLSEEFGHGWHWAMNFIWEKELTGKENEEWAVTQAISKTIIDSKLSIGVEMNYKWETTNGHRDNPESQFNIGPSIQWRPTPDSHIDVVALPGLTEDGPDFEGWLVMGFDFGAGTSKTKDHSFAPVSSRQ